MKIVVAGAGSWGTALAHVLAGRGHAVRILARDASLADIIDRHKENPSYLPGIRLDTSVSATTDPVQALPDAELCVLAIPSQHLRAFLVNNSELLSANCHLVCASKGIETGSLALMHEVVEEVLPGSADRFTVLSGPSFALELAKCLPTAVTVACRTKERAADICEALGTAFFRLYSSDDLTGVQVGGALKNVLAIAVGIAEGMGLGLNVQAALVTRGLAEITRLGMRMGGREHTFMGLSGLGDLSLTCHGGLSRNRRLGILVGRGEGMEAFARTTSMVAEGAFSCKAAVALGRKLGVEMPISEAVNAILYQGLDPSQATEALLNRPFKAE